MTLLLLSLFACEFEGIHHRIRFDSNLLLTASAPWSPVWPVAAGTEAAFQVVGRVGEKDDALDVVPDVRGADVVRVDGNGVVVRGEGGRARLRWTGEVEYEFSIAFRPVADAGFGDAVGPLDDDGRVALLSGSCGEMAAELRDRRGNALGYARDDLAVVPEGAVRFDGDRLCADGSGAVAFTFLGEDVAYVAVDAVPDEAVAEIELVSETLPSVVGPVAVLRVVGRDEAGRAVHGIAPAWSIADEDGPLAAVPPDVDAVEATWEGLTATWAR
jgi:hypothetical protein